MGVNGIAVPWSPEECVAVYKLLLKDPTRNIEVAQRLFKRGKGAFPKRNAQNIAGVKTSRFGFANSDGKIDISRAVRPYSPLHGFWALAGLTHPGMRPPLEERPIHSRYFNGDQKMEAIKAHQAGETIEDLNARMGIKGRDTIGRWARDYRKLNGGPPPSDPAPQTELKLEEPLTLELPPSTASSPPQTVVTFDDGAGMKFSLTIKEHISTVIAKVAELSQQ